MHHCEKCNDTGVIEYYKDGYQYVKICECQKEKMRLARLKESGFGDMVEKYTFERFNTDFEWQKALKEKARRFILADAWFCVLGQSGSGKTHICSAICNEFLKKGKTVKYMPWGEDSTKIKQFITDAEKYSETLYELKNADVLFIDDFFKNAPTSADLKLAMDIINYRYIKGYKTIISSEKGVAELNEIDPAIFGRIVEMSHDFLSIIKGAEKNYRLRGFL